MTLFIGNQFTHARPFLLSHFCMFASRRTVLLHFIKGCSTATAPLYIIANVQARPTLSVNCLAVSTYHSHTFAAWPTCICYSAFNHHDSDQLGYHKCCSNYPNSVCQFPVLHFSVPRIPVRIDPHFPVLHFQRSLPLSPCERHKLHVIHTKQLPLESAR